ncbi:LOW QUALITY PROTEIN: integrator complex subunit 7 [Schistocerca nitens]|uniref:LOW QUALITY PROTEIN: integrator complex subunit 7 n=1 Tax=Schistocerca nitens TaxID=7011 RepID=UPI0021173F78|nr:LOW QUALITY PROTEIN: integrator complex subunit 7 [Schistocerca nitens]
MIPVRVNSFNENGLGEPEQDANTALTELDKGLRSGRVGEQCEAIVRFPRLFEKYPFPILINASLLKLADLFRIGNNFLRVWVLQVCQQSEKHLDKILNVDEFVRRIYSVIHSNDPVARALTLRTLGSVAGIIPERQQVHHSIRRSLDSHDTVEVEAAIYAAMQFAAQSKTFALSMCNKISDMIRGLATPANMKLQLIPILQHMHHDTHSAALVRQLCTELLPSYPAQEFVSVTLKTLTQLAAATLVDIPSQVTLLLEYLREDPRWAVKAQVVRDLRALAQVGAHLWPAGAVEALLEVADTTPYELLLSRILDILLVLAQSAATCQAQLGSDSPLMSLCERSSYSANPTVAAKAVQVMTDVVCYCSREDVAHDVYRTVDTVELLFLVVAPTEDCSRQLSTCLRCAVSLCRHRSDLVPRFVQLLGAQLVAQDLHRVLLCEALGAIGGFQAGALVPILPDLLQLLQSCQGSREKVMLCTLIFQTMLTYEWPLEIRKAVEAVSEKADLWANYRIARSAARYGHHAVAANIFGRLQENVASEQLHFWLVSLEALCRGETALQGGQLPGTVQRIETAVTHCCKATAALKAASTPAHSLQFATDYTRLRGEFLQCLAQLAHACHSLCTAPPPAVASSVAESSRDPLQRFGHITAQLRKCVKDFRLCGEMYWKLYQSAFDADPASLANIQILQQMCVLMAHTLERVSQATYQEDPVLDFSDSIYQQSNLETQQLVKRCQQASALAQQLPQAEGPKVISHQHVEILLRQVEVLSQTPLYIPRFFFQVLQSTSVKLAISPQPRVPGEPIAVQSGSQLAVKVEGVILHGRRWAGRFRQTAAVTVTVSCQLQQPRTAQLQPDTKMGEAAGGSVLTQTVSPHRDYFTAQFLLAFPVGGQYMLLVEAAVLDERGDIWRTGPRASMAVKAHEEPTQRRLPHRQGAGFMHREHNVSELSN